MKNIPTIHDIRRAAERIRLYAHRTPVLTNQTINHILKAELFFKCENFQKVGAFKFRGACNTVMSLTEAEASHGVATHSSGNHAQALALAGALLGIPVTVIMPQDAPAVKRAATEGYGAEVLLYDKHETTREALGRRIAEARGVPIIPPYDHPLVIAGQGTTAQELIEETGPLDLLLVCCGGGGLLSGCAVAAHTLSPGCRVVGVEPAAGDDATRSFHTGTLHTVHNPDTLADGARTPSLGTFTFPLVLRYVDDMVTVTDAALVRTMFFLWERMKIVVEPTGVLAAAALLEGAVPVPPGARVGVVLSGGNVDLRAAAALFQQYVS